MRIPRFHNDEYADQKEREFRFQHRGLWVAHYCRRLDAPTERIRTAIALKIRNKVIQGFYCLWKLNDLRTHWTLHNASCNPPKPVAPPIGLHEVYWALGTDYGSADFESYGVDGFTAWMTVRHEQQCGKCRELFQADPARLDSDFCGKCLTHWAELKTTLPFQEWCAWLPSDKIHHDDIRKFGSDVRWVRKFAAKGKSFTKQERRAVFELYGNICLCCKKKLPLEADHVIPLARGGTDDITNIQPLCSKCHDAKGMDSTDYRPN
jgi:hypothetical protein